MFLKNLVFILFGTWFPQEPPKTLNPEFSHHLDSIYRHTIPTVTVEELKVLKKQHIHLLDAREEEEYNVSHLKNARHVGYIWFDMRSVHDIDRTDTVVVYCAVGNRSERISEKLRKAGFEHVFYVYGGIFEWVNQRNPVYTKTAIQTTEIHGYNKAWSYWLENGVKVW